MALFEYSKYQILINSDSKKVQGLQAGDIVRRQYFDGANSVYSLMCVLSSGVEKVKNTATGTYEKRSYFIGALLDGGEIDCSNKNELLDFVRVTNLFDINRLGALHLTASDSQSPYLDVIDGIGKNKSLCWPVAIPSEAYEDPTTQYVVNGTDNLALSYIDTIKDNNRILTVTRTQDAEGETDEFEGLKQDFYQFVNVNEQVLVSYKIKGSKELLGINASLGYTDGLRVDAEWTEDITTDWEYKFRVVTIEYSGRHLRSFKLDMSSLEIGEDIKISDFNIILLSSIANFSNASATRIGKLDGVTDSVFGQISGYGVYVQKLYASSSAHISGTLTAGDENGFGATFYAGKIHRNCFVNSLSPNFKQSIHIEGDDSEITNPTGVGSVFRFSSAIEIVAQTSEWCANNTGSKFTLSFWLYAKHSATIIVMQNGYAIGTIGVDDSKTYSWRRVKVSFNLLDSKSDSVIFKLTPTFTKVKQDDDDDDSTVVDIDEKTLFFSAPQLESGNNATQYQATDDTLNPTTEYGAWFNRGGIGGTIQNPLLQLNYKDEEGNEGGIGTKSKSLLLRQDGSGYVAQKNIVWDKDGKVTFNDGVTLNWDNFNKDVQDKITNRYCRIIGDDTFTIIGLDANAPISPTSITLTIEETGFTSTSEQRKWLYKKGGEWYVIEDENALTLTITPDSDLWGSTIENGQRVGGESTLTVRCLITLSDTYSYTDTKTIHKQYVQGYSLIVTSSSGSSFQNGNCSTTLTANVYYQGSLVDPEYAKSHFNFIWHRYNASDMSEIELDGATADANTLTLSYDISSSEIYVCELSTIDAFDYSFPVIF